MSQYKAPSKPVYRSKMMGLLLTVLGFPFGVIQGQYASVKTLDVNVFYGSVLLHNTDISHLITQHPAGFLISLNNRTFGERAWHQDYGYPDWGFSAMYQDMGSPELGKNLGIYAHLNTYFLKRHLQLRLGQGIAYNTNPYDAALNFRNNAYGSHLLSSTFLMLQWQEAQVFDRFGFGIGVSLSHFSNGNIKAPNTSTNTFALSVGISYELDPEQLPEFKSWPSVSLKEPIHFNLMFRGGINESDVIGSGQYPFYMFSTYVDKRLGKLSALEFGTDLFFSGFLKELIQFQATSFPELEVDAQADYRRAGVFVGHELFMGKLQVITQLGYYIYYPFDFEGRVYNRIGAQRRFGSHWQGGISLKSHGAKAEAVEFGFGYRW